MEDCELGNSTGSLLLTCRPGFDGGLSQVFNLEILVTATRSLLRNITRHEPRFQLGQLHASQPVGSETYSMFLKFRHLSQCTVHWSELLKHTVAMGREG